MIPVRNDAPALSILLNDLRQHGGFDSGNEVVVVDGASTDDSLAVAARGGARTLSTRPNRGAQLQQGVDLAAGEWLWMLHADARISSAHLAFLDDVAALELPAWGRFDVTFDAEADDAGTGLAMVASLMNARSRLTGICTGDQGIFAHRRLLARVGGVPGQPLMEDIELSRRLRRLCRPLCPALPLRASARRWRAAGLWRTIVFMWWLRLRYWLGADPVTLARLYHGSGSGD